MKKYTLFLAFTLFFLSCENRENNEKQNPLEITTGTAAYVNSGHATILNILKLGKENLDSITYGVMLSTVEDDVNNHIAPMTKASSALDTKSSSFEVALDDLTPETMYYYSAWVKLHDGQYKYGSVKSFKTKSAGWSKGSEGGYEYVDLGLSVKWATMNVGSYKVDDYGQYYSWGETSTKSEYDEYSYKFFTGVIAYPKMTKYCTNSNYGTVDNKRTLDASDDVAHVRWGGRWRMPTYNEYLELENNSIAERTTLNGVNGTLITSTKPGYTDCSIFLPAAGYRLNEDLKNKGVTGYYWTSDGSNIYARAFIVGGGQYNPGRWTGLSVRPVCP